MGNFQSSSLKKSQLSIPKESKRLSSTNLNPKTDEMRRVFDKFDANKDGKISKEEYKLVTRALGTDNGEKAFQFMDTDRDGFIDFEEFMRVQKLEGGKKDVMRDAFNTYDLDGNGKISAAELMAVMRKLGEPCDFKTCQKMVKGVDLDDDGNIDMKEFMSMMTKTSRSSLTR